MKIAIYGYGNLGRGVEAAMRQNPDVDLIGAFTRRDPATVKTRTGLPVYPAADILKFKDQIDVLILCGGSATDLPELTPTLAKDFCVVDSFDTHANIPTHFERVDAAAQENGTLCLISAGWDPGMFSLARVYAQAILPEGQDYTFWGRGVSQGHSDAIRRIPGVVDARQYTVPVPEALEAIGAMEHKALYEQFLVNTGIDPLDPVFQTEDMDAFSRLYELWPWEDFDDAYLSLTPVPELLEAYIQSNPDAF